jgi:hypothetical protein
MYIITSAISGTLGFIFLVVWVLLVVFTSLSILRNINLNIANKILWIAIILVVPILGSLVYLFFKSLRNTD